MYVIVGASGQVGRFTADQLLSKGLPVRAVLRDPAKAAGWQAKGAETAIADLKDPIALAAAFEGAKYLFVMTPPLLDSPDPMTEHDQMLAALSTAISNSHLDKLVYLSSVGAHLPAGTGAIKKLYDMEQAFHRLTIPTVGIRAAWFMENFTGGFAYARENGHLPSFLNPTDRRIPMVATRDIGHLAAQLLQSSFSGHQHVELEGPCRYSADDVAAILSGRMKKDISAHPIPTHLYETTYESFGFTPAAATMMAEMHKGFNSGLITFEGKGEDENAGLQQVSANTLLEDALNSYLN